MALRRSLLAMFCGGGLALAQYNMTASQSGDQVTVTFTRNNQAVTDAVTGRPYSATLTSERTTPDGTRMIQPARRTYRDSLGRTRIEEQRSTVYPAAPFLAVEIVDPVGGDYFLLDSENHVAHRLAIKEESKPAARPKVLCANNRLARSASTLPGGIAVATEPLGEQTIEGAVFCGSKSTTTYPAGSTFHNDRPVKAVTETWNAWDDGLPFFLLRSSMPGGETSISWIKDVSLSEPDPALFRPPADYAIVEQPGSFAVRLARSLPAPQNVIVALTGMPFAAEGVNENRRTDPSGAILTRRSSFFEYRDSQGRTAFGPMVADSAGQQTFRPWFITDAVAGYLYLFDEEGKTVHRQDLQVSFKPASQAPRPKPASQNEWLGTQTIDGFQTFGRRSTWKYPPGTIGGNDRPFVIVDESWYSPELGIQLRTQSSHPQSGDTTGTVRLTLGEPDKALFRVPDSYRIIDDSESMRN